MSDSAKKMTESVIVELVKSFLLEKVDGNWHEEKVRQAKGHSHGADLVIKETAKTDTIDKAQK